MRRWRTLFFAACSVSLLVWISTSHWQARFLLPTEKSSVQFYSPHLGHDLEKCLLFFLDHAEKSVQIASYGFTSDTIAKKLSLLASRGVKVELLLDHKNISSSHLKLLSPLIIVKKIKSKGLMHRKWAIIDDHYILMGTANITRASLKMHHNFMIAFCHHEAALFLRDPSSSYQSFAIGDQQIRIWLLPNASSAFISLYDALQQAQKEIKLALFTFTHPLLSQALIDASCRGIKIEVLVDGQSGRGASWPVIDTLYQAGIDPALSVGLPLFHHKVAQIDKTLFMGSANWTAAAFKNNMDDLVEISPLTKQQLCLLDRFWREAKQQTVPLHLSPEIIAAKSAA